MIFVPEIILKQALDIYLKYIYDDIIANASTPENSFLKLVLGDEDKKIGTYDFYTQAKTVFDKTSDNPRRISVDYMYNAKIERFPNIFIHLGSQTHSTVNGMSFGMGIGSDTYLQTGGQDTPDDETDDTYQRIGKYSRRMSGVLNVVILSDNFNELLVLYYLLQAGLISLLPHLNLAGYENIRMSGQDLFLQSDQIPKNCYKRVISLNFEYTTGSLDLYKTTVIKDIQFILQKIYEK